MDEKEIGSFNQAPELTDYLSDCESYIKTKNGLPFLKRKKLCPSLVVVDSLVCQWALPHTDKALNYLRKIRTNCRAFAK